MIIILHCGADPGQRHTKNTSLLDGATDHDVASTVAERFGIPEITASADITALLAQLRARKLVNR